MLFERKIKFLLRLFIGSQYYMIDRNSAFTLGEAIYNNDLFRLDADYRAVRDEHNVVAHHTLQKRHDILGTAEIMTHVPIFRDHLNVFSGSSQQFQHGHDAVRVALVHNHDALSGGHLAAQDAPHVGDMWESATGDGQQTATGARACSNNDALRMLR